MTGDIANLTFEDALRELESIVRRLEEGKTSLSDALNAYERGALLKRHCETILDAAKMKVDQIVLDGNRPVGTAPLATDDKPAPT